MTKRTLSAILLTSALAASAAAQTAPRAVNLLGTTEVNGWANFNSTTFTGTGSFPGTANWNHALVANVGAGGATLLKTANGVSNSGAFVSSSSLYFGSFAQDVNGKAGTITVADATPVAGVKTVVFQMEIGESFGGYDLWNHAAPVLSVTTGNDTSALSGTVASGVLAHVQTGTFTDPFGVDQPIYRNLRAYQWDLSGVSGTIDSYSIAFTGVQHAQAYAFQLDATDRAYGNVSALPVPEPASMAALALGALGLVRRKRRA